MMDEYERKFFIDVERKLSSEDIEELRYSYASYDPRGDIRLDGLFNLPLLKAIVEVMEERDAE